LSCYFPALTKGNRVRYQITINANPSGQSPIITSCATKASLARVWRTTVSCKRNQQLRSPGTDDQAATPQDLIANIQNAYANAGKCIVFIPSPKSPNSIPPYVETVRAALEDYSWSTTVPGVRSNEQFAFTSEGDCELVLAEILG